MAYLEIKSWKQADDSTRDSEKYTVHVLFDHRHYRVPGFRTDSTGKRHSEELGRNVHRLLECRASGTLPPDLRRYVELLPSSIRRSLARQSIIDAVAEGKTLIQHLTDFVSELIANGTTERHAREVEATILHVATHCGAKMMGQLTPPKFRACLAERRKENPLLGKDGKPQLEQS